jgi:sterol desaturase/sphingolipid hydroxylase (fatty acid hydroxylase superfamily)
MSRLRSLFQACVTYGAYPVTLLLTLGVCTYAVWNRLDYEAVYGPLVMGLLAFYIAIELLFPLKREWGMTFRNFFRRDVKYFVVNGVTQGVGRAAVGWLAIWLSLESTGPLRNVPFYLALPILFMASEFLHYWYHRLSHELHGPVGGFLWRVHAAHHLPDRVYVLMHAVGHPLDLLAMNILMMAVLPPLLGCTPDVTFVFVVVSNLHGIVSHLNVDIRAGWLNYLFSLPEVHRYHHSTEVGEAKNYGSVWMLFDHLFGTFVYRPGRLPDALGVSEPERYPASTSILRVLALPFTGGQPATAPNGEGQPCPDDEPSRTRTS